MNKEEILDIICDIYEQEKISEFNFDLKRLCKSLGINLMPYSLFGNNIKKIIAYEKDGFSCLNPNNNQLEIYYNDKIVPKGRIKFTIPHELGHICLGHKYYLNKETSIEKREADIFANELYCSQAFMIYYGILTVSDLISNFGITRGYAQILLDKLKERKDTTLSFNEKRLIEIFEKNKLMRNKNAHKNERSSRYVKYHDLDNCDFSIKVMELSITVKGRTLKKEMKSL